MRLGVALLVGVVLFAACDEGASSTSSVAPTTTAPELYPAGAVTGAALVVDGVERRFIVAVPPDYPRDTPAGVVFDLHGRGGSAPDQALTSGITDPAWREGLIVVHPQARGAVPTWPVWPELPELGAEIEFFSTLIEHLAAHLPVDRDRIFVTGFSNGGGMAGRLACEMADRIAAIAPVGASNEGWEQCAPSEPVPVLAIHGAVDRVVPYDGSRALLPSLPDWAAWWAAADGCTGEPEVFSTAMGRARRWADCPESVTVTLIVVDAIGHIWPDRVQLATPDGDTPLWKGATDIIVEFFAGL